MGPGDGMMGWRTDGRGHHRVQMNIGPESRDREGWQREMNDLRKELEDLKKDIEQMKKD
jgi:hypothetical protein